MSRFLSTAAAAAALLGATQVQADTIWAWSYTSVDNTITASGTFTTAGDALVAEDILSITGQRNGMPILGLVPLGDPAGSSFIWDNQFTNAYPYFSEPGILFDVGGGDTGIINLYFDTDDNVIYDLVVIGGTSAIFNEIDFSVSQVPEPATYGYMALGLVGLGIAARRRKTA